MCDAESSKTLALISAPVKSLTSAVTNNTAASTATLPNATKHWFGFALRDSLHTDSSDSVVAFGYAVCLAVAGAFG